MRVLVVCLGNICRSPAAEAALKEALRQAGLADRVRVDSAGTGDWHLGEPPDPRMVAAAHAAGLTVEGTAARIGPEDFAASDLILVMDRSNLRDVLALAPDETARDKVRLFREFDPDAEHDEVPDPYYGGADGFHAVVVIVRQTARGVVAYLRQQLTAA